MSKNIMQLHVYISENGEVDVPIIDREVWLSQKEMAALFGVNTPSISKHIASVMDDYDLDDSSVSILEIVARFPK